MSEGIKQYEQLGGQENILDPFGDIPDNEVQADLDANPELTARIIAEQTAE